MPYIVANIVAETLATKWTGNIEANFVAETLATKFTHNIVANL